MLDTQDPDIIVDLRKIIGEKGIKFDVFWNEMQDYLNEVIINFKYFFCILYIKIISNFKRLRPQCMIDDILQPYICQLLSPLRIWCKS
jgi:hypothetical protein